VFSNINALEKNKHCFKENDYGISICVLGKESRKNILKGAGFSYIFKILDEEYKIDDYSI